MKSFLWVMGVASALSLATVASATTCPTDTWCFGSNPETVSDGTNYSSGLGTISAYGEQITNSASGGTYLSSNNSTINGLFSTNDSVFDEGIGIAPYDPSEGSSSSFSNQNGITDTANGNSKYGNILVLELGSNIADGTTLSFLLQAGDGDGNVQDYTVAAYYQDGGSTPDVSPSSMTKFANTVDGQISTNGTTPQFSVTKNTSGVEFIAIEADCHYILLDTITGVPTATPEPRFYSLLLAGFLGLAGLAYQKRRTAQANA
jgi:hypothetical protein